MREKPYLRFSQKGRAFTEPALSLQCSIVTADASKGREMPHLSRRLISLANQPLVLMLVTMLMGWSKRDGPEDKHFVFRDFVFEGDVETCENDGTATAFAYYIRHS